MSAYFSATETAFSCANRIKLKNLSQKGSKKAQKALNLCEQYDSLISTILIGNNIVNILGTSITTIVFVDLLGDDLGPTIATIVTTIIVLIFGEISPKTIANEFPEKFAMFSSSFIIIIMKFFTPLNFLFQLWKKVLSLIFKPQDDNSAIEEELITMVEEAEESGDLDKQEKELIQNAIEFNDLVVGDIFTPRIDMVAISKTSSINEIEKIFHSTAYSRLPIYDNDIDNIIGVLNYKDFFKKDFKNIEEILKPTIFVIKNRKIKDLLKDLQKEKIHIAIVIDEFSETIGMVTMEDILEEIVGEIWDEHDEIELQIKKINENEFIVSGNANISTIENTLNIDIETEVHTISGLIMELIGRFPKEKDIVNYKNYQLEVLELKSKRIEKISIKKINEDETKES